MNDLLGECKNQLRVWAEKGMEKARNPLYPDTGIMIGFKKAKRMPFAEWR